MLLLLLPLLLLVLLRPVDSTAVLSASRRTNVVNICSATAALTSPSARIAAPCVVPRSSAPMC